MISDIKSIAFSQGMIAGIILMCAAAAVAKYLL